MDGPRPRPEWVGHFDIVNGSPVWRRADEQPTTEIVEAPAVTASPVFNGEVRQVVKRVPVPTGMARPLRSFILTYTSASMVEARTPDEAIALLRSALGEDVDISSVQPA